MRTLALLCTFLALITSASAETMAKAPAGSIILDFKIEALLGKRAMKAHPKVAVGNGKEAEVKIVDDEDGSSLVVKVLPTRLEKPGEPVRISVLGGQRLQAIEAAIPGDPSSAAFLVAAGILSPASDVQVDNVMSNPTRSGFYDVANLMGAHLGAEEAGEAAGERQINIASGYAHLKGIHVPERY
ncbi:MAG: hypothetical protein KC910_08835, partial [Candidatus Eremiobacteraeota bacterium]|nr:hypothetical protein [Candidatus Eremiobacteraeota bacterium]